MSTQEWTGAGQAHPLAVLTDELGDRMERAAGANAWTMTPGELQDVLPRLTRAKAQLEALELRVLVEADRATSATTSERRTRPPGGPAPPGRPSPPRVAHSGWPPHSTWATGMLPQHLLRAPCCPIRRR